MWFKFVIQYHDTLGPLFDIMNQIVMGLMYEKSQEYIQWLLYDVYSWDKSAKLEKPDCIRPESRFLDWYFAPFKAGAISEMVEKNEKAKQIEEQIRWMEIVALVNDVNLEVLDQSSP